MFGKYLVNSLVARLSYVILAIFCVLFRIYYPGTISYTFMLVSFCYIIIYEIYAALTRNNTKKVLKNTISVMNLNSVKRLSEFPLPVVVCDENGELLWYSEKFIVLIGETFLAKLKTIKALDENILTSKQSEVSVGDSAFEVYSDGCIINEKQMYILYFFDKTDYVTLQREQQLLKPVVAYILLDNYDEIFKNVKESDRSVAMAKIEDALSLWAQETSGIIRKIDRNRYIFIFENRFLSHFISNRFDILDTVRKLPVFSTIPPTISIGMGCDRLSFAKNEEAANAALDMALSRGGDQVAISRTNGYEFFGGYANIGDTRAKIRSRVLASAFAELVSEAEKVIIMGHKFADMDSLGACIGIMSIAASRHKKTYIVLDTEANLAEALYDRLALSKKHSAVFITKEEAMMTVDLDTLLVIVDTHRASYTEMPELVEYAGKIAVIDHHRKAADFIQDTAFFFHEPYASSTCEMVTEIIEYLGNCNPSQLEAEALLAGIYLDTKNFTIKTGTCTFEASAFLKSMGASTINVKLMFQTDMETYKLRADIVKNTEIYRSSFAISVCNTENGGNIKIATSQAADEMLNIEGIQATFTIYDIKGVINISSRSFGNVNVQIIMEKLGGGGHQSMAGAQLRDVNIKEAHVKLTNAIDAYLEEQGRSVG